MARADDLISARLRGVPVREAMGLPASKPVVSGASNPGAPKPPSITRPTGATGSAGARPPRPKPSAASAAPKAFTRPAASSMGESFGMGLNNELTEIKTLLHHNGYGLITDDSQYGRDVVAGRERYSNPDGTQVHLDLSPNDNSPGKRGAWVFHMRERSFPGFGARQLADTIAIHHRRMAGLG